MSSFESEARPRPGRLGGLGGVRSLGSVRGRVNGRFATPGASGDSGVNTTHATLWMLFIALLVVGSGGLGGWGVEANSSHVEESVVSKRADGAGREAMRAFMEAKSATRTASKARA